MSRASRSVGVALRASGSADQSRSALPNGRKASVGTADFCNKIGPEADVSNADDARSIHDLRTSRPSAGSPKSFAPGWSDDHCLASRRKRCCARDQTTKAPEMSPGLSVWGKRCGVDTRQRRGSCHARLDRAIQYSRGPRRRARSHHIRLGVLDAPPSRGMTAEDAVRSQLDRKLSSDRRPVLRPACRNTSRRDRCCPCSRLRAPASSRPR